MTDRKRVWIHTIILWIAALGLRLGYFFLALQNLGMERLAKYAPDTEIYYTVAQHILSGHPQGGYALFRVGPGYGLILASIKPIFGADPLYGILFSILMGSLAPVAVYLLALNLTKSRAVSMMAGIVSAVSLTSLALSSHILTDQPAFTIHAFALASFAYGFRNANARWFVLSGLLAGIAAYVRPSSQLAPLILLAIPLFIPLQARFYSKHVMYRRALLAGVISILMILAWSARNYIVNDSFTFGSNGALTFKRCMVAQVTGDGTNESIVQLRTAWEQEDGDQSEDYVSAYRKSIERTRRAVTDHPGRMISSFFKNVDNNIKAGNLMIGSQVPELKGFIDSFNRISRHWLSYLSLLVTIAGLIYLIIDRNRLAWLLLGATYLYFTLITGFSFWQGSRLHYPAEMASSILIAYAFWRVTKSVVARIMSFR